MMSDQAEKIQPKPASSSIQENQIPMVSLSNNIENAHSIDLGPIEQAEAFLEDINAFIDKLWQAQNQEGQRPGAAGAQESQKDPVYKSNKDFSVELEHYVHECEWLSSQLQLALSIRRDYADGLSAGQNAPSRIFQPS